MDRIAAIVAAYRPTGVGREQSLRIHQRQVSTTEVVDAYFRQIARHKAWLNAVVTVQKR